MKFIYGFIPKNNSLQEMIEQRAQELAEEIILRTSNNMELEELENSNDRIKKAIQEKSAEIINKMPRHLWD